MPKGIFITEPALTSFLESISRVAERKELLF